MYTLISESTNSEFQGKIEFPNLKDLYKESPLHQEIEYFSLSKLYDNLDYDVVVLKPVDDDFLILYANSTLWGIINIDFPEYMKGRYLSELFPKFIELNTLNKFHYSFEHETSNDVVIKFYKDEILLFAGQQFCVKHDDLLYVFAKNETEYYSNQVKEDTIFEESIFPKIQVSRYGEILKINKEFFKVLGYTFEELNQIGLDNIIRNFKASTAPVDNFTKMFTYIFRNNIPVVDAEIEIISKNNISKLFTSHARLFTNDKINVTLSEITDYKKSKRIFFSLMNYFKELEGFKNIAFNLCDGETFQWTPNIFEMLEIPEDDSLLEMSEDIICDYVVPEDKVIIEEKLNKISISNTLNLDYRVKTGKGRIKYFRTVLRGLSEDEGYFSFTTDITEEYNVRKEAIELQRNLNVISSSSNVGMVQFKEGKYYYTPEVYKILDIESEDYVSDFDIIKPLVVDDEDSWLDIINHLTPTNSRARKLTTLLTEKGNVKIIENIVEAEFDENNEIKSYVSFVRDITEEEFAKQNALELQENLRSIEEFSKIVLVSFKDGEFSWTPEIYNILKINPNDYLPNENILKDFIVEEDLLLFNEKVESLTAEDNSFSLVIRVKDSEGELKYLKNQIVFNFNDNNNFLSANALLQDVTEEFLAKESAFELQKSLEIIEKRNNFVITHYKEGHYYFNDELFNILEINPDDYPLDVNLIELFTIPDDSHPDPISLHDFSPEQPHIYNITTIKTPNGNVKVLESYIEAEFDDNGDLFEHVAFIREITDSVMRQREVERLSEERKILLQEVHHRVKNNLQLINSFLSLDSRYYNDDPKYVIDKAQNRLDAMAITHEEIYQSDDMAHINLKSLIHSEISSLFRKFKINNIKQNYFLKEVFVDTDKAISLSLLINELAFNCIKHAFPDGSKGNFSINLNVVDGEVILRVWDDGVGLPDDMDFYTNSSLGFLIIQRLTVQLEAEIHIINDIPGFGVKIIMPL